MANPMRKYKKVTVVNGMPLDEESKAKREARELLLHAQMHLFDQVSGERADKPLIEDGYNGLIYRNALGSIFNCIQMIECEENLKAIKGGYIQPYPLSWKY